MSAAGGSSERMAILSCLLFIVVLLSVMGAGVLPAAVPLVTILACGGCLLVRASPAGPDHRLTQAAAAVVLFLSLTALPLPAFMDSVVGRQRADQNAIARQAVEDAGKLSIAHTPVAGFSVTRDRAGTWRTVLLAIAGLTVAALASRLRPPHNEVFLKALVLLATVVAAAGFTSQHVIPEGKTLWWFFTVRHGHPVGGFMNRNHFGGFVALLCPAALVLFSQSLGGKRFGSAAGWAFCFLVMTFAVIMSFSRGAWIAYGAALFAVAILALASRSFLRIAAVLLLLVFVAWGVSRLPSQDELEERAKSLAAPTSSLTARMRMSTWRDTLRIMPDYAAMGVGANAFRMVFPQYRSASTRPSFKHAENEYLQTPAEMGLIGTALLIILGWVVVRRWRRARASGALNRVIEMSVGGALIVAAVHALFDFAIRIPLHFVVVASLVGLVISPPPQATSPSPRRLWALPLAGLILAIAISLQGTKLYDMDSPDFIEKAGPDDLCRALNWSPTSWQAWYHLGRAAVAKTDGTGMTFGEYCMTQAAVYDPNNYRLWRELCMVRLSLGDTEGAQEAYANLKALRTWVHISELERP